MSNKLLLPDAGPIISLGNAGRLWLLKALYGEVVTTRIVAREITTVTLPNWLAVVDEVDEKAYRSYLRYLDPGESSVLALAKTYDVPKLLLDDLDARKASRREGYAVVGTLGIVIAAQQRGLIDDGEALIVQLVREGLWVSNGLIAKAIALVKQRN